VSAELVGSDGKAPQMLVMSQNPRVLEEAATELRAAAGSQQEMRCVTIDLGEHQALAELPDNRPEFLIYDPAAVEKFRADVAPPTQTATFGALWSGWAAQNFFDTDKVDALYPSRADLRLLRASRLGVYLLVALVLGLGGWSVYSLFKARGHPSWALMPEQVVATKTRNAKLLVERSQIDTTESLLLRRSQGWSALEMLLQLFPEGSDTRLQSFDYKITPAGAVARGKVGVTREWQFKGLGKPETMQLLSKLSSQRGLTAFFESLSESTGDKSFEPGPTRQVKLTVSESRNPKFDPDSSPGERALDPDIAYPYSFQAVVSQTLTESDILALPIAKPL
jgi:hypothetical protein